MHIPTFTPPSIEFIIDWAKEWQPLLGGLLVVIAACIFVAGSRSAVLNRAGGAQGPSKKDEARQIDLRHSPALPPGALHDQPVDLIRSLDRLRSLVRSALSALTSSEITGSDGIDGCRLSCERIIRLTLEKSALPQNRSKASYELLDSLKQQIAALSLLLSNKGGASDITAVLLKVNIAARNLAVALGQPSSAETPLRFPVRRRQ